MLKIIKIASRVSKLEQAKGVNLSDTV